MRRAPSRRRGYTFVELMTGILVMSLVLYGSVEMFRTGMQSYRRTTTDAELHMQNATGLRRVAESIRGAMSASITSDDANSVYTLTYYLPVRRTVVEPLTGEYEIKDPMVSDGVLRRYQVSIPSNGKGGTLKDLVSGKVLVNNILAKDPAHDSTQFNQQYRPFQLTTIGSLRAITLNLITEEKGVLSGPRRNVRMKTTVVLRNSAQ